MMKKELRDELCELSPSVCVYVFWCARLEYQMTRKFKKGDVYCLYLSDGQYDCGLVSELPDDAEIVVIIDPMDDISAENCLDVCRQFEMAIDALGDKLDTSLSYRIPVEHELFLAENDVTVQLRTEDGRYFEADAMKPFQLIGLRVGEILCLDENQDSRPE